MCNVDGSIMPRESAFRTARWLRLRFYFLTSGSHFLTFAAHSLTSADNLPRLATPDILEGLAEGLLPSLYCSANRKQSQQQYTSVEGITE